MRTENKIQLVCTRIQVGQQQTLYVHCINYHYDYYIILCVVYLPMCKPIIPYSCQWTTIIYAYCALDVILLLC